MRVALDPGDLGPGRFAADRAYGWRREEAIRQIARRYRSLALLGTLFVITAHSLPAQKLLAEGIRDLGEQISATATRERKQRIAILPLRELYGQSTVLGAYLSEELTTFLVQSGKFQIVERSQLDRILGELKLDRSGLIDAETAKKLGKFSGADAILTGTITDLATFVGVNCRMIDGQTGQVQGAAQVKIAKDADVNKIMAMSIPAAEENKSKPAVSPDQGSAKEATLREEAKGISFELKRCKGTGNSVECDFLIQSTLADQDIYLKGRNDSRLVDSEGNEAQVSSVAIGSQSGQWGAGTRLIAGVSVKSSIKFEAVPPTASVASLVEIRFSSVNDYSVKFRNVPIQRR